MHFKNLASFGAKKSQIAVGLGKMPIRAIFEALAKIKYPGWVDLEYEVHGDERIWEACNCRVFVIVAGVESHEPALILPSPYAVTGKHQFELSSGTDHISAE